LDEALLPEVQLLCTHFSPFERQHFGEEHALRQPGEPPASTLVDISALVGADCLIEIKVVAVVTG